MPVDGNYLAQSQGQCNETGAVFAGSPEEIAEKILNDLVLVLETDLPSTTKVRIMRALVRYMPTEPDA